MFSWMARTYEDIRRYIYIHIYIHTYIHTTYVPTYIHTYVRAYVHTHIHTFIVVTFDTGTNLPAVSWKSLLAVAMMNIRHR